MDDLKQARVIKMYSAILDIDGEVIDIEVLKELA